MKLEFGAFRGFFINQRRFKEIYFSSQVQQEEQFNSTLAIKEQGSMVSSREHIHTSSWAAVLCHHDRKLICNPPWVPSGTTIRSYDVLCVLCCLCEAHFLILLI